MNAPLSNFDSGILATFNDGVVPEMGDKITLKGTTIDCNVTERSKAQRNIRGGKSLEIRAVVEVLRDSFLAAGGNKYGGDEVVFSDGEKAKISSIDDFSSAIYTLRIGPVLEGAAGPQGGAW